MTNRQSFAGSFVALLGHNLALVAMVDGWGDWPVVLALILLAALGALVASAMFRTKRRESPH